MFWSDRAGSTRHRPANRLTFAIALSIAALAACATCGAAYAGKEAAKAADIDTEHLFGFTEGSDIGEAGEKELEVRLDVSLRQEHRLVQRHGFGARIQVHGVPKLSASRPRRRSLITTSAA